MALIMYWGRFIFMVLLSNETLLLYALVLHKLCLQKLTYLIVYTKLSSPSIIVYTKYSGRALLITQIYWFATQFGKQIFSLWNAIVAHNISTTTRHNYQTYPDVTENRYHVIITCAKIKHNV